MNPRPSRPGRRGLLSLLRIDWETPPSHRGQVLVIVALGLVVIVAMVGLVIDGGYAWGQQRQTQNASDSAAEAGAVVLVQRLAGVNKTDADVWSAVSAVASSNGYPPASNPAADCLGGAPTTAGMCAYYTDVNGARILVNGNSVAVGSLSGGLPPAGAAGVEADGHRTINTFLARVIGISTFNVTAPATAVAGYVQGVCDANLGCAVLPVTLPVQIVSCDGSNNPTFQNPPTPYLKNTVDPYVVPLCKNGPGNVGWLDWTPPAGGTSELINSIQTPDNPPIPVPSWQYITATGNVNSSGVENAINVYAQAGTVVLIPQFDSTCDTTPSGINVGDCPAGHVGGNGQNQWYHLPQFAAFQFCNPTLCPAQNGHPTYTQGAYISGNNKAVCDTGNGATSCLVGRFVDFVMNTTVTGNVGANAGTGLLGVQLIH